MRRKEKYIVNGILIAAVVTAIADVIFQWFEHRNRGEALSWNSYDGLRTFRHSIFGAAVGGGIGYAVYCSKISEEAKLPFNSDEYLKKVLNVENLKSNPTIFKSVIANREKIKQWLVNEFGNKLVTLPEDAGSFYKRTAIGSNYDLDIVLPFKKSSYNTLSEMYYDVFEIVSKAFGGTAKVFKQSRAIGLTIDHSGYPIHFDIVPGREINNYVVEKDLQLYVKPDWIWQRGSSFKTNIEIQKTMTVNQPEARRIIKLLKAYRDRNALPLPTLVVEQCVISALSDDNFGVNPSDTENLLNSMDFISKKMKQKSLIDVANSNNNLHDKVTEIQKTYISNQLRKDIHKIEENPRYIKEIFEC